MSLLGSYNSSCSLVRLLRFDCEKKRNRYVINAVLVRRSVRDGLRSCNSILSDRLQLRLYSIDTYLDMAPKSPWLPHLQAQKATLLTPDHGVHPQPTLMNKRCTSASVPRRYVQQVMVCTERDIYCHSRQNQLRSEAMPSVSSGYLQEK